MITIIHERVTGTRTIAGTDWPVETKLYREKLPGQRPTWIVTRGICNGTARESREHKTRWETLEDYESRP